MAQQMPPGDLSQAGAVVDKAIEYMLGQGLDPLAAASALLGGSLGLMARTMGDDAILKVLGRATASVRSGEVRAEYGPHGEMPARASPAKAGQG
jgi:hypothetical protein